ncbi:MAG: anaerobic sulfatase maturase [Bacteroidales bacterium]
MEPDYNYGAMAFPVYVSARSAGNICNLKCTFCDQNLPEKDEPDNEEMSDDVLEKFTRQYIEAQIHTGVCFYWKGGEPLLRGIDFYQKALRFQQIYSNGKKVTNTIFTNGSLIDSDWCNFFKKQDFLVNVYLDGPKHCHNKYRLKPDGTGNYDEVMFGISLLRKFGVRFNIHATIHEYNVQYPLEMYRFFKSQGFRNLYFHPLVGGQNNHIAEWSVPPLSYGSFLCEIFDDWVRHDVGRTYVSVFEDTLNTFCRKEITNCKFHQTCGHSGVVQYNGDIYSCDHFSNSDHLLGNMNEQTITGMMYGRKQLRFGQQKRTGLTMQCKKCNYLKLCNGGCPKDRIGNSANGERGHNILCLGYQKYFAHVSPAMTFMAEEIAGGGTPARVMSFFGA